MYTQKVNSDAGNRTPSCCPGIVKQLMKEDAVAAPIGCHSPGSEPHGTYGVST
ncbi:uncharacterized protein ACLA_015390 [Aspergillus clavatus NRRL 1]|uniref:Uncharacterized protein n=1 Tax=Aspergillus clavatus (strain ATCC 1007 / CBS 513.65 / DSM 816 / NCTC 3887 / NRRL 1 / QM 1276 / 107) TaxID=344612 RepID=A1CBI1_ASPCL|nr:uncharacterized protein ACLA_015390 [Aspergillus clavatus NRRL 1]EAW13099.1 hypothetical protein ACLA_015390 [Aspergillus clavatus NRRL 1]